MLLIHPLCLCHRRFKLKRSLSEEEGTRLAIDSVFLQAQSLSPHPTARFPWLCSGLKPEKKSFDFFSLQQILTEKPSAFCLGVSYRKDEEVFRLQAGAGQLWPGLRLQRRRGQQLRPGQWLHRKGLWHRAAAGHCGRSAGGRYVGNQCAVNYIYVLMWQDSGF